MEEKFGLDLSCRCLSQCCLTILLSFRLVLELIVGGSLDQLWKLVNIIQVIAFLQLFNYSEHAGVHQRIVQQIELFQRAACFGFKSTLLTFRLCRDHDVVER